MVVEKERNSAKTFIPIWTKYEHEERYEFATKYLKDKVVIDCACGSGIGTNKYFQGNPKYINAFDVSIEAVKEAKEINKAKENISIEVADGTKLPLNEKYANVFISFETIEHIEDDTKFIDEVYRVLNVDGLFISSTPNRTVTNPGKKIFDKPWNKYHVREYSKEEYIDLISKKFQIIEIYGQNKKNKKNNRIKQFLGKIMPLHLIVRINQFNKLVGILFEKTEKHRVELLKEKYDYEYLVVIAKKI